MGTSVPQVGKIVSMDVSRAYEELKKLLHDNVLGLKLILAMHILYTLPVA